MINKELKGDSVTPKEIVRGSYPNAYSERVGDIFYIRTGTVPDTETPCPNCGYKKSLISVTGSIGAGSSPRQAWRNALPQVNDFSKEGSR